MSKDRCVIDILCKYHPRFKNKKIIEIALANPDLFRTERGIEQCLAIASGGLYTHCDETGRDFSDDSDSKCVTINLGSRTATVMDADKLGALRITLHNPFVNELHFMYIPKHCMKDLLRKCFGKCQYSKRLLIHYGKTGHYGQFDSFLLPTFESLATATG